MLKKSVMQAFFFTAFFLALFIGLSGYTSVTALAAKSSAAPRGGETLVLPTFKALQWKANVLVITGDPRDALAEDQFVLLRGRLDDLKRHDVAVLRFVRDRISEMQEFSDFGFRGWYDMNANQQRFVEGQVQADNNVFSVVLIDKSGVVKQVWTPLPEAPQTVPVDEIIVAIERPLEPVEEMNKRNTGSGQR